MFERFLEIYGGSSYRSQRASRARPSWGKAASRGWDALMSAYSGASFRGGLYRLHDADSGVRADRLIGERFPADAATIYAFGWDWMGRQFVLDGTRRSDTGEPLILLVDLLTGDQYFVDYDFVSFHDVALDTKRDATLDADVFEQFAAANPQSIPLNWNQIVGYKIPLQLGGQYEVSNMEVVDVEVELAFSDQIREQVDGAAEGTPIRDVTLKP